MVDEQLNPPLLCEAVSGDGDNWKVMEVLIRFGARKGRPDNVSFLPRGLGLSGPPRRYGFAVGLPTPTLWTLLRD